MSHLETFNADSAESKDVWNENLEFLMNSAVSLHSAVCLLLAIITDRASLTQCKVVWNENSKLFKSSAVCLLLPVCLLFT